MTQVHAKSPCFCNPRVLFRVRSPSQLYSKTENFYKCDDLSVSSGKSIEVSFINGDNETETEPEPESPNRVMVVVDASAEAKTALQWALSHAVQTQDTIVLLHIAKPSMEGINSSTENNQRTYAFLSSMKYRCQMKRPGVNVEISIQEGKEKGPIIVDESRQRKVSLLVLGQRKRSMLWQCLQMLLTGKRTSNRVVEYCIQNANCMTIAVRRKGKKHGGYLITTKRHKNFWLLA